MYCTASGVTKLLCLVYCPSYIDDEAAKHNLIVMCVFEKCAYQPRLCACILICLPLDLPSYYIDDQPSEKGSHTEPPVVVWKPITFDFFGSWITVNITSRNSLCLHLLMGGDACSRLNVCCQRAIRACLLLNKYISQILCFTCSRGSHVQ
jgi:hypothetical protein